MALDQFMKRFLLEELKDFPNTTYRNDCWYSFTPQGLMHQIFILRRRTGQLSVEYGTRALVAPLWIVPGNSVKKEIFGRPSKTAWSGVDFRLSTMQEPECIASLHKLLLDIVAPAFHSLPTIQSLYDFYLEFANRRCSSPRELYGTDIRSYLHPYQYFSPGEAAYVFSYLCKADEGLVGIQKMRELRTLASRGDMAAWGYSEEDPYYQEKIRDCLQADEKEKQFLLLSMPEQKTELRKVFKENCTKIHNLLGIDPEFDLQFIFSDGG